MRRFIDLLFNDPFAEPTNEEYFMFCAQAAAYRSLDLDRQVGAVIVNHENEMVTLSDELRTITLYLQIEKNRFGDMVVMSMDAYENLQFSSDVYAKLLEAEHEAEVTHTRYSSKDVLQHARKALDELG